MKKAKIMLVAIATFGIVGGVLASKAKSSDILYTTTQFNASATSPVANLSLVDQDLGTVGDGSVYYTAAFNQPATITQAFIDSK